MMHLKICKSFRGQLLREAHPITLAQVEDETGRKKTKTTAGMAEVMTTAFLQMYKHFRLNFEKPTVYF